MCVAGCDVDDDEDNDIFDVIYLLNWLGGVNPPPQAPCCAIPGDCGLDPDAGPLSCERYPPCGAKVADKTIFAGAVDASELAIGQAVLKGPIVTVPVTLKNAEPLVGFHITIEHDPTSLRATLVDNTGLATEEFDFFVGGVNKPGQVDVVAVTDLDLGDGVDQLQPGEHVVATIFFKPKTESLQRDVPLKIVHSLLPIDHLHALNHHTVDGIIGGKSELPTSFGLSQNCPNPFNPTTEIRYALPQACSVTLEIFNVLGQKVRTLVDHHQQVGYQSVVWDSRDDRGQEITAGVYFYSISAGQYRAMKKMVLLK